MRWIQQHTRIVKRFALFPVCIDEEYRWLEIVYIEQKWTRWYGWRDFMFTDRGEYLAWKKG